GLRAAYHRLAGNAKPFEGQVAELRKLAADVADPDERRGAVEALLLNGRAADALELLGKLPIRDVTFDLLATQSRFKEAFAVAGRPGGGDRPDEGLDFRNERWFYLRQARWLYLLGETDQAVQT